MAPEQFEEPTSTVDTTEEIPSEPTAGYTGEPVYSAETIHEIERLRRLKDEGEITYAEFEIELNKVLKKQD